MEPQWTKGVSSSTVCDWFFFFFCVNAVVATLSVGKLVFMLLKTKMLATGSGLISLLLVLAMLGVSVTNSLFFYLICDRGLKPSDSTFATVQKPDSSIGNSQANYVYRPSNQ